MGGRGDHEGAPTDENRTTGRRLRDNAPAARWVRYGRGMALVFEFTGTVAAGVVLGYVLDRQLGTDPWLIIVLTLAAVTGGFIRLVQVVERLEQRRD